MAHLNSYLPSPGSAVWRRDVASSPEHQQLGLGGGSPGVASASESSRVRHIVIRDAEIWDEPAPYVVSLLANHICLQVWTKDLFIFEPPPPLPSLSSLPLLPSSSFPLLPLPSPSLLSSLPLLLSPNLLCRCIVSVCWLSMTSGICSVDTANSTLYKKRWVWFGSFHVHLSLMSCEPSCFLVHSFQSTLSAHFYCYTMHAIMYQCASRWVWCASLVQGELLCHAICMNCNCV